MEYYQLNMILFLWCVLCVNAMEPEIVDLLTPLPALGEACGYDACPKLHENKLNVHIVAHSHSELGFFKHFDDFWTGRDYDEDFGYGLKPSMVNMKKILDATITELWANEERKFTLSDSELPYFFYWWARRDGTVRRMVYQLLRQGRLNIVGGGWGMHEQSTTSYQSIIDSYTYSLRKLNRTFLSCGRPLVAWQADNFGHSREYASLVAQMGFDGIFISPMSFDDEIVRMDRKALEFLWRGSDDLGKQTDIFTSKLFDGYWSPPGFCFELGCTDPLLVTTEKYFTNIEERVELFIEHMKYRQSPYYKTNHIMVIMGKSFGYYAARTWFRNIDALISAVNERTYRTGANIHLHYSSPNCYLKAVHSANPVLEPKQDDFLPFAYDKNSYMSGLFTSRPDLKYFVRVANAYLQMAKQLQVLARLGHDDVLEAFMWIMGVMQDHNIISGAVRNHAKSYYIKRLDDAIQKSMVLLEDGINKLHNGSITIKYNRCEFNSSSCTYTKTPSFHMTIYNPLAWRVSIPVRVPVQKYKYIVYDSKGDLVTSSLLPVSTHMLKISNRNTTTDHELTFIASDIPPLGFKSYYFQKLTIQKRSIIKKLNPHPQKKYYIRQASDVYNKTYFEENANYDDLDDIGDKMYVSKYDESNKDYTVNDKDDTNEDVTAKIDFASINNYSVDNRNVVTPNYGLKTTTVEVMLSSTAVANILKQGTDSNNVESITDKNDNIMDITSENVASTTIASPTTKIPYSTEKVSTTTEKVRPEATRTPKYVMGDNGNTESSSDESYYGVESKDLFIENKYIRINLDNYRKVSNITLSNNISTSLDIQFHYYVSDDPVKLNKEATPPPGAYLFRPMDPKSVPIIDFLDTKIYKTDVVQEIHTMYSEYGSIVLKLYADSPFIEIDWTIGPVPIDDELGKEVFIRYSTDLDNSGVFYTDANGRQTVKRIRDRRATYEPYNFNKISGNFYPVTSRIHIEDTKRNVRFAIFNDRSQGGASLLEGSIDLMIQRRILTDDAGVGVVLNETIDGQGVIISGKHYLYVSKANYKQNKVFEKKLAKEIELKPIPLISNTRIKLEDWLKMKTEFYGLNKLPVGVHLLTLQNWNDGTLLIRLENYLEKCDTVKSGIKHVYLKHLFVNIDIERIKETTLAGNLWLSDWTPMRWETNGSFVKNFNDYYGADKVEYNMDEGLNAIDEVDSDPGIRLMPQQIRTFVVWYKNKNV